MTGRTILVKIAAYRDPELIVTMAAALQNASHPDDVRFAVVHQYGPETRDTLDPVHHDPRVRRHEIPWQESTGLGRARRLADEMYDGEDFTLQVDAHMRFLPGWDANLIAQWDSIGRDNSVLSCYPGRYTTDQGDDVRATPTHPHAIFVQGLDRFGLPGITAGPPSSPFSTGLLVAGCFQFAAGAVTQAVPAQPEVLIGDETVHAVRLFTAGYDVLVPQTTPMFHRYAQHKDWKGTAHTPFADFRESDDLWERFTGHLDASLATARDILARDDHPALGSVRSRPAFFDALRSFCLPGVDVPRFDETPPAS